MPARKRFKAGSPLALSTPVRVPPTGDPPRTSVLRYPSPQPIFQVESCYVNLQLRLDRRVYTGGERARFGAASESEGIWLLSEEWSSRGTLRITGTSFRLSLTLTKRPSRLEAGRLLHQVETCYRARSRSGVLTESAQLQAAGALVELGQLLLTSGQELQLHLRSKPTTILST